MDNDDSSRWSFLRNCERMIDDSAVRVLIKKSGIELYQLRCVALDMSYRMVRLVDQAMSKKRKRL